MGWWGDAWDYGKDLVNSGKDWVEKNEGTINTVKDTVNAGIDLYHLFHQPDGGGGGGGGGPITMSGGTSYGEKGGQQRYQNTLWAPQEQRILTQFAMADNAVNMGPYTNDRYATWTPYQKETFRNAVDYYNNVAPQNADYLTRTGQGMMGNYNRAQNVYGGIAQNGGVDSGAINDVMASQQPYINQQMNTITNSINRNADRQMAAARENLAGSNGLSGTRGAVQQGLINEGANNALAEAATSINTNAYNNALTQANQNVNNRMSAANNLASLGNYGSNMFGQGIAMHGDIFNSRANIGNASMENNQRGLANDYARWNSIWDVGQRYGALVGNRQWGGGRTQNNFQSTYSSSLPYDKDNPGSQQSFDGAIMPWQASGLGTQAPRPQAPRPISYHGGIDYSMNANGTIGQRLPGGSGTNPPQPGDPLPNLNAVGRNPNLHLTGTGR